MYKLYIWYPWSFGRWIYKGEFTSLKALKEQIKNKRETTYKITKENVADVNIGGDNDATKVVVPIS